MRNLIDILWEGVENGGAPDQGAHRTVGTQHRRPAGCTRIRSDPGHRTDRATAIVAAIGNGDAFRKGRDFAAWLGVVPRQYSTGGNARLLGISKRATYICARFSYMARELPSYGSSEVERPSAHGRIDSMPELSGTSSWLPWRTSWHALHGPCIRLENTMDHFGVVTPNWAAHG